MEGTVRAVLVFAGLIIIFLFSGLFMVWKKEMTMISQGYVYVSGWVKPSCQ